MTTPVSSITVTAMLNLFLLDSESGDLMTLLTWVGGAVCTYCPDDWFSDLGDKKPRLQCTGGANMEEDRQSIGF